MAKTNSMFFFKKTRNVKTPERAHPTDAGLDIFVPEFDEEMASTFVAINPDNLRGSVCRKMQNSSEQIRQASPGRITSTTLTAWS